MQLLPAIYLLLFGSYLETIRIYPSDLGVIPAERRTAIIAPALLLSQVYCYRMKLCPYQSPLGSYVDTVHSETYRDERIIGESQEGSPPVKMVLAHPQKCVACHLCEGACSFFHEGAFQPAKTRIFVHDFVDEAVYLPVTCFHCKDAPCLSNCPTYAITRDANGMVQVNDDKCIGCKMCMVACPFSVMGFHEDKNVSHNCDLCGGDPQCVKICTYDALEYADVEPIEWMVRMDIAEKPAAAAS